MTMDSNVVPRTEVMEARAQVIQMKKTLEQYEQVHFKLIERSNQEHDVHVQIQKDLQHALKERHRLEEKHQELQRTHTPRPDWVCCSLVTTVYI